MVLQPNKDIWAEVQIRNGLKTFSAICTSSKENTGFPMLETGHHSSDVALWNYRCHTFGTCIPEKELCSHLSYFIFRWDFLKSMGCWRIISIVFLKFCNVFWHFSAMTFYKVKKTLCELCRFHMRVFSTGSNYLLKRCTQVPYSY